MKLSYKHTKICCYLAYFTQASVITFLPLLFMIFHTKYGLPYAQLGLLVTVNFAVQMTVDLTAFRMVDQIGYRKSLLLACSLCFIGFTMISVLPNLMSNTFAALCIAVITYSAGGALIDIVANPLLNALPIVNPERKAMELSMLHAVFCWSQVILIVGTTLLLRVLGSTLWWIPPLVLALVPLVNFGLLLAVPVPAAVSKEERITLRGLFSSKLFIMMCVGMACAGGIELVMAQWASSFAESALHLRKTTGDLVGPCLFALMMGVGRTIYGVWGDRINLIDAMILGGFGAVACYLVVGFSYNPIVDIVGCAMTGLCVSFMWPGIMSVCAADLPTGGAGMFAVLAVFGDSGGSLGPVIAGWIADRNGGNLHTGLLFGLVYCAIVLVFLFHYKLRYAGKKTA